ncbi:MAG: bifunctional nuclease family protein [Verrucomicrobia bacterium]|nr:bifunctional nuclease family protein [Verrucomicrobiota bacterium]
MNKSAIPVQIRALIPTNAGTAVFLGNDEKVFTIYIDQAIGAAISLYLNSTEKERPLTHDLLANVLTSLGAKVERVAINDFRNGIYYGRLIITAENELQQRKIIELDARSSDCMAMAALQKSPIYVSGVVWDEVEDMTPLLERLQQGEGGESTEGGTEKEEE